jgi:hypothetical protein
MSLAAAIDLYGLFGDFPVDWELQLAAAPFVPLLAGWLALRHGDAGLRPLLVAAPLVVIVWDVDVAENLRLTAGLGLELWALALVVAAALASRREGAAGRGPTLAGEALWALGLAALAVSADVSADLGAGYGGGPYAFLGLSGEVAAPVGAFAAVLLGRMRLATALATLFVVAAAGFALEAVEQARALADGFDFEAGAWWLSAGWGKFPGYLLAMGWGAALTAALIRLALAGGRPDQARGLALAALAAVLVAPGLLQLAQGVASGLAAGAEPAQTAGEDGFGEMIAVASRPVPVIYGMGIFPAALLALAGAALASGRGEVGPLRWAMLAATLALLGAVAGAGGLDDLEGTPGMNAVLRNLDGAAAAAAAVFTGAWIGRQLARRRGDGAAERGEPA